MGSIASDDEPEPTVPPRLRSEPVQRALDVTGPSPAPTDLSAAIRDALEGQGTPDLQSRLAHADRLASVGQLAAGIAHEICNPATVLSSNLALLQERAVQGGDHHGDQVQLLQECTAAMEQMMSLVRRLGRFSRLSSQPPQRTDLCELVQTAICFARPSIRHRARLQLVQHELPPVVVDRAALTGVLVNLLVNAQQAIDASGPGAHQIRVTLTPTPSGARLCVEDSGPGVPEDHQPFVFEPFFTRNKEGGLGLGLAICRDVVRSHHGQITVDASDLGGAAFTITLPWETGLAPLAPRPPPAIPPDLKILVIDDDPHVRRAIVRLLSAHRVVQAGSGTEGWRLLFDDQRFDVILCDLVMPAPNGQDLFRRVCSTFPRLSTRFVFVTGDAISPENTDFLESSQAPILAKPFTRLELSVALQQVIRGGSGTP